MQRPQAPHFSDSHATRKTSRSASEPREAFNSAFTRFLHFRRLPTGQSSCWASQSASHSRSESRAASEFGPSSCKPTTFDGGGVLSRLARMRRNRRPSFLPAHSVNAPTSSMSAASVTVMGGRGRRSAAIATVKPACAERPDNEHGRQHLHHATTNSVKLDLNADQGSVTVTFVGRVPAIVELGAA